MSNPLTRLQSEYEQFVEDRDWGQFQTPKNVAEAISIEANELLECYLWHDNLDAEDLADDEALVDEVKEELADVVIYCLGMASTLDIDLEQAVEEKLAANEQRFDEERSEEITEQLQSYQR